MPLGFGPGAPLYEVVEHLRWRWPNARIAFDEVVLEDRIAWLRTLGAVAWVRKGKSKAASKTRWP